MTSDIEPRTSDKILISGIGFYGYLGVREEEQTLGQRFEVDVECALDLRPAGESDELTLTVDYADVVKRVTAIGQTRRFRLLEALAEAIATDLLGTYPLQEVRVRVVKPSPPVPDFRGAVAVEIHRRRKG